jgi:hypothetical protein
MKKEFNHLSLLTPIFTTVLIGFGVYNIIGDGNTIQGLLMIAFGFFFGK